MEVTIQVSVFINDGLFNVTHARPMMLSSGWDVDLAACQAYNLLHNTAYVNSQHLGTGVGVGVENPNGNGFYLYYEHGLRVTDLSTVPQNSCLVVGDGPFVPFRMPVADDFGSFVTGLVLANQEDGLALNSQSDLKERLMVQSLDAVENQFFDFINTPEYVKAHEGMVDPNNPSAHQPIETQHSKNSTHPPTATQIHNDRILPLLGSQQSQSSDLSGVHTVNQDIPTTEGVSVQNKPVLADVHSSGTLDTAGNGSRRNSESVGSVAIRTPEDSAIECGTTHHTARHSGSSGSHRSSTVVHNDINTSANMDSNNHNSSTTMERNSSGMAIQVPHTAHTHPRTSNSGENGVNDTEGGGTNTAGDDTCTFEQCQEHTVAEVMGTHTRPQELQASATETALQDIGRLSIAGDTAPNNAPTPPNNASTAPDSVSMSLDVSAGGVSHADALTEGSLGMLREAYKYPTIVDWVTRRTLTDNTSSGSARMSIDDTNAAELSALNPLGDMSDMQMEEAFKGLVSNITLPAINMTTLRTHTYTPQQSQDQTITNTLPQDTHNQTGVNMQAIQGHPEVTLAHTQSASTLHTQSSQSTHTSDLPPLLPMLDSALIQGLQTDGFSSNVLNGDAAYNWADYNTFPGMEDDAYNDILKSTVGVTEESINEALVAVDGDSIVRQDGALLENSATLPTLPSHTGETVAKEANGALDSSPVGTDTPQDNDTTTVKAKAEKTTETTTKKPTRRKTTAKDAKAPSGRTDNGAISKAPRKLRVSDKNWRDKVANQLEDLKNSVPALDGEIKRTKAEIFNGATQFIRTTVNDNAKLKWQIQQQKRMIQEAECVHKQAKLRSDTYAANNGMLILEHDVHTLTLGPKLVYADHHWKLMTGHLRPEGRRIPELCGVDHNPFMFSACDVLNRTLFDAYDVQWFGIMICRRHDGTVMGCHSSIEPVSLPDRSDGTPPPKQSVVLTSNWYILDLTSPIVGPGGDATTITACEANKQIEAQKNAHMAIQPKIK